MLDSICAFQFSRIWLLSKPALKCLVLKYTQMDPIGKYDNLALSPNDFFLTMDSEGREIVFVFSYFRCERVIQPRNEAYVYSEPILPN